MVRRPPPTPPRPGRGPRLRHGPRLQRPARSASAARGPGPGWPGTTTSTRSTRTGANRGARLGPGPGARRWPHRVRRRLRGVVGPPAPPGRGRVGRRPGVRAGRRPGRVDIGPDGVQPGDGRGRVGRSGPGRRLVHGHRERGSRPGWSAWSRPSSTSAPPCGPWRRGSRRREDGSNGRSGDLSEACGQWGAAGGPPHPRVGGPPEVGVDPRGTARGAATRAGAGRAAPVRRGLAAARHRVQSGPDPRPGPPEALPRRPGLPSHPPRTGRAPRGGAGRRRHRHGRDHRVAVSHLHNDHAGGLRHFAGRVPVHAQRAELEFGLADHPTPSTTPSSASTSTIRPSSGTWPTATPRSPPGSPPS